jgi:hypothetical protein
VVCVRPERAQWERGFESHPKHGYRLQSVSEIHVTDLRYVPRTKPRKESCAHGFLDVSFCSCDPQAYLTKPVGSSFMGPS